MSAWNSGNGIEPRLQDAIGQVAKDYGHSVALKNKALLKFGRSETLGTSYETVWQRGGSETFLTDNLIDKISSSDNGDTQDVVVEGHTIDGSGNLTFVTQSVTLAGQTETALTTPMARANRMYNNDSTDFAGVVYVYEDDTVTAGVPQTTAKIHLQSSGSSNQSLKAATSISQYDYWFITSMYVAVTKKTTAVADFDLQVRDQGKVFRTRFQLEASSDGSGQFIELDPVLMVKPNSDVRIQAVASTTNVAVTAWMNGPLALINGG